MTDVTFRCWCGRVAVAARGGLKSGWLCRKHAYEHDQPLPPNLPDDCTCQLEVHEPDDPSGKMWTFTIMVGCPFHWKPLSARQRIDILLARTTPAT